MMIGWSETENYAVVPNAACMDWQNTEAATVAEAGLPAVQCYDNDCYINYVEGSSVNYSNEPPFVVGGTPSYLSLSTVYAYNPMPSGLASQYQSNILGAQCNLWGEYVPSFRNVMFKMFPRETAMAENTWTPLAQHNFTSFTNRLVTQEQRFNYMGLNYDHEGIPPIGTWSSVPSSGLTVTNIISPFVTSAGEIDINFWYNNGTSLNISSVALLVNGVQVDIDVHSGTAESQSSYQASEPFIPIYTVYVLHLPNYVPGAIYTVVSTDRRFRRDIRDRNHLYAKLELTRSANAKPNVIQSVVGKSGVWRGHTGRPLTSRAVEYQHRSRLRGPGHQRRPRRRGVV